MPTDSQPPAAPLPPLGDFELLEKVGEGGMGTVYRARQTSLNREVALKVLTSQLSADRAYIDSFRREAQSAGRLVHPNIIPVFDAGEVGGTYYYAMEFVNGQTLHLWVQHEGALPEKMTLEIGICVASALKHAWDKERIIHRDVKPENVIIDPGGNVKLCDLGLAKNFGQNTLLSLHGQAFGTPQYMSPEQARAARTLDCRSDIYSLGMTLYYTATARLPFHGGSPAVVMARHLTEQLPDPREFESSISENFCRVLERMLAKSADERYQSWDDVLRDLQRARAGQPSPLGAFVGLSSLRCQTASARKKPKTTAPAIPTPRETVTLKPVEDGARPRRSLVPYAIIAALVVVAGALFFIWSRLSTTRTAQEESNEPPSAVAVLHDKTPVPPPVNAASVDAALPPIGAVPAAGDVTQQLLELQQFITRNPNATLEITARVQKFAADFPNAAQTVDLQQLLKAAVTPPNPAPSPEEEKRRKEEAEKAAKQRAEQERLRKEEAAKVAQQRAAEAAARAQEEQRRLQALAVFADFSKKILAAFAERDYAAAARLTEEAKANAKLEPLKRYVEGAAMATESLEDFWSGLKKSIAASKGKTVTLRGLTGDLGEIGDDGEFPIEISGGGHIGFALAQIPVQDALALSAALTETAGAELSLTPAWLYFAEGKSAQAEASLRAAQKAGQDTTTTRELMTVLALGPLEYDAERWLAALAALVEKKQWNEARTLMAEFKSRYETTKAVETAHAKVSLWESSLLLQEAAAKSDGPLVHSFQGNNGAVLAAAFSPDGRRIISGSTDKLLHLWDAAAGKELNTFKGHGEAVRSLEFSQDGRTVISGSYDRTMRLWDVVSGQSVRVFKGSQRELLAVALSPDGRTALSGSAGGLVRFWEVQTAKITSEITVHNTPIYAVAFSADGRRALSASEAGTIKIWETATSRELQTIKVHNEAVFGAAFTPDGNFILSGSADDTLKLSEVASGKEVRAFRGHGADVRAVAISPDGRWALSGSNDRTMRLWDIATGKELRVFPEQGAPIRCVAFSPDGQFAISGTEDGALKLWKLFTAEKPVANTVPPVDKR